MRYIEEVDLNPGYALKLSVSKRLGRGMHSRDGNEPNVRN